MKRKLEDREHHFVYKTERLDGSAKYYIGVHSTDNPNDGYLGSGTLLAKSIKRHGKDKHRCTVLERFNTRAEALLAEKSLLSDDVLADPLCMNLVPGGGYVKRKPDHKLSGQNKANGVRKFYVSDRSLDARRRISEANKGKKLTPETIQNMSVAAKNRIAEMKADGRWEIAKKKNSNAHKGKLQSEETKKKRAAAVKLARIQRGGSFTFSDEARKNIGNAQRGTAKNAANWIATCCSTFEEIHITNLENWCVDNNHTKARTVKGLALRANNGTIAFMVRRSIWRANQILLTR